MSGPTRGSGGVSAATVFERTVEEAVRRALLRAQANPVVVPPPDDFQILMASRIFGPRGGIGGQGGRTLTFGTHLTGGHFDGSADVTLATDSAHANTASTLVERDSSGDFAAHHITADLIGNADTATLATAATTAGTATNPTIANTDVYALDTSGGNSSPGFTIANNATQQLGVTNHFSGIVVLEDTNTNGRIAFFLCGAATVKLVAQIGGDFSDVASDPGLLSLYYSSGSLILENKTGSSRKINSLFGRTRAAA